MDPQVIIADIDTSADIALDNATQVANATLVTYHKTGTVLAKGVNDDCFAGLGIKFDHKGALDSLPAVHFIRDPKALIRSAYDYHRESREGWLHDPEHTRQWLLDDPIAGPTFLQNETYHEYLHRVPFAMGVRAEFLRSSRGGELTRMLANSRICMANPGSCMQVCLEHFTQSSESYQKTWSSVLDFLGLDQSYLDCIKGYDLLNPNYVGEVEEHATTPLPGEVTAVYDLFQKLDEELMNHTFAVAGEMWRCAPMSLLFTVAVDAMTMEFMADKY